MRQSPATAALIVAFIIVWFATWFDVDQVIFLRFAKVNEAIRAGEVWRLFTASFLHAGPIHLWFNAMALASIGPSGVLLAHAARAGKALPRQARKALVVQVLFVICVNVAIGLIAGFIDNAAHIGGLVGGFALGLVVRARGTLLPSASPQSDATGATPSPSSAPRSVPSRATRRPGRSYLGWAGQRWKMVVLFLGSIPFAISMFQDAAYLPVVWMLAFGAGAGVAASARCPSCRVRVFWWCISKLPANRGLETALQTEKCPICEYPDAPAADRRG